MILVHPNFEILNWNASLPFMERAGRTCYKSEGNISINSAEKFVLSILKKGHETVIEHSSVTVRIICDRGVTHEIVRHRLASYCQESTRYCNYSGGVTFVIPPWTRFAPGEWKEIWHVNRMFYGEDSLEWGDLTKSERLWFASMLEAEQTYSSLLSEGWSPQQARSVLPNSLKTEIVMTCNLREWKHFFRLRTAKSAHPQMREIACPMLMEFQRRIPIIFEDIP